MTATASLKRTFVVALAGNPNSGKTTIFNALTGLRQKVANYPGVTVEKKTGKTRLNDGTMVDLIDLPGTYSLISRSPDESIAMQVLRGLLPDTPAPDAVICVVDASNLQRNLYLVSQLMELGRPLVIALNMVDIARRRGLHLSSERLSQALGVPVVPVVGHKHQGIDQLKQALLQAKIPPLPAFPLPELMTRAIHELAEVLKEPNAHALAERLLTHDDAPDLKPYFQDRSIRHRVESIQDRLVEQKIDPIQADIEAHYCWIEQVSAQALEPACETLEAIDNRPQSPAGPSNIQPLQVGYAPRINLTDRLDRVLLHKVWGMLMFSTVMASLFIAIFILADPLMGATEEGIANLGSLLADRLPDGPVKDLWTDGIVAGVGAVLVFVPQIAMLFLFLAILEDSGYLARAAFLMDRVLGKVGLNGKSFIPLLSSFACAIPGIMATRTIENRKDRLATIFIAPFMSCSARLPVYGLLIGTFFAAYSPWVRGGIMFACYGLGVLAAVVTALIFHKTFMKTAPGSFVLELPSYKIPQIGQIARVMATNTWAFIRRAGTIIFCLSVILWAMAYYPRLSPEQQEAITEQVAAELPPSIQQEVIDQETESRLAAAQLEQSISGRIGHFIEPVIRPLGYDWKIGVGLIASFAAREVFVSQMGIIYAAGDTEEDVAPLEQAMLADRYPDASPVWTAPVAISLLVWFVLAMQCISTTAIVRRETGSWSWAIGQILYMNALAYVVALLVYQITSHLMG